MILDKFVEVIWGTNNKKYYIDNNYIFTKLGDKFFVNILNFGFKKSGVERSVEHLELPTLVGTMKDEKIIT